MEKTKSELLVENAQLLLQRKLLMDVITGTAKMLNEKMGELVELKIAGTGSADNNLPLI